MSNSKGDYSLFPPENKSSDSLDDERTERYSHAMYNKLFSKILDSSIWLESNPTRLIWITLLATMDEDGFCHYASIANLAHRAVVEKKDAEIAVGTLESPDIDSSDPDHEGRRIERVPGGWMVLNAGKYRALASREMAKEKTRQRVAAYRQRNAGVTDNNVGVQQSETVTEAETHSQSEAIPPDWVNRESWDGFVEMRKRIKKPLTERAKKLLVNKLAEFKEQGCNVAKMLDESTMNNWQGVFDTRKGNGNGGSGNRNSTSVYDEQREQIRRVMSKRNGN